MSIWLIGAGKMAQDYAKVLIALNQDFEVIGRGKESAKNFKHATGINVVTGGVDGLIYNQEDEISIPETAIIAVGVEQLAPITTTLIRAGVKKILLEKPGGLNFAEISGLARLANEYKARVLLAYNRRFYKSTREVKKCIEEDGGVQSVQFEFTEWAHKIAPLKKAAGVKERWLIGNSSHVIDLVFHLCGVPSDWQCWNGGSMEWHPTSARFAGAGITDKNVFFSYISDWQAPGRWGIELMTSKRRLILRPMERLQFTELGSIAIQPYESDYSVDEKFKPGLYLQTKEFLNGNYDNFPTIKEQERNTITYSKIAGY